MPLCRKIAEIGNVNIISDAGVAVLAARAAFKSAELNVYVNASGLEDKVLLTNKSRSSQAIKYSRERGA